MPRPDQGKEEFTNHPLIFSVTVYWTRRLRVGCAFCSKELRAYGGANPVRCRAERAKLGLPPVTVGTERRELT